MNKHSKFISAALLAVAVAIFTNTPLLGQRNLIDDGTVDVPSLSVERRPFDFSDRFYRANGIEPAHIINRPTGTDGLSTQDFTSERNHTNVRILATRQAYGPQGEPLFWNLHGEFYRDAFTGDTAGDSAIGYAMNFPIYVFPNHRRFGGGERQSAIINAAPGYFEKNRLGLGMVLEISFNPEIRSSDDDAQYLSGLAKQNGMALDGTPLIRTVKEIEQLRRRDLITISLRGSDGSGQTPFIIGKVMEHPGHGAIANDAFLLYLMDRRGRALGSEQFFFDTFECHRTGIRGCGVK